MQTEVPATNRRLRISKVASRLALLLCLLIVIVGCGLGSDGKHTVRGNVTWNGQPLETGTITFFPESTAAPEAGKIVDGDFSFRCFPGTCRVVIRAERFSGMIESMNQPRIEQYIPSKYNVDSTLTAEVSDDGPNSFTFDLIDSE